MTDIANHMAAATAENMHTEAAMIGARAMGTELENAFQTILKEIDAIHELQGSIEIDHQKFRYMIASQVNTYLSAMGII